MKRLLLTGGSGMVGRNILSHPMAAAWDIHAPGSDDVDLTDSVAVAACMREFKPDVVIHAAGRVGGIHENVAHPVAFLDDNARIGRNVVMEAHNAGVRRLINIASTNMYPQSDQEVMTEDMVLSGPLESSAEPYGLAKILTTRLCQYIRREDASAQFKTLIPCNLYGPHDKFDPARSHLLPAIIHKVHQARTCNHPEVEIWGDGTARRQMLFAPDFAEAALKAAADIDNLPDLMNVGPSSDCSINDYYAIVAEVIGWQGNFTHDTGRPVGLLRRLCDTTRLKAWGWSPPTSLRDGIVQTYHFYLESAAT